jgi:hypothetical protein
MSIAVSNYIGQINQGDTAELCAGLRQVNELPVDPNDIVTVSYTVQLPDGSSTTQYGSINDLGQGFLRFGNTQEVGPYKAVATFTLTSGEIRSSILNFTVTDPFAIVGESPSQTVVDQVWLRIEDCFDSLYGGPWLRDKTRGHFDQTKIAAFIPEAILDFNVQMPPTDAVIADFTTPNQDGSPNPILPILVKGLLVRTVMHLIRSYIEQPVPAGAQVVYEDRTRYSQTWKAYYDAEYQEYIQMVRLYKRQLLQLGHSRLLVASKAANRGAFGTSYGTRNISRIGY